MKIPMTRWTCVLGLLAVCGTPAWATVSLTSVKPSLRAPQAIGTTTSWKVKAKDSNPGPLAFQFNIAPPGGSFSLVKDFNQGVVKNGSWEPPVTFEWTPTGIEGTYQIQVVIKDFTSGETSSEIVDYAVNPLVTGATPVVAPSANPLVAYFSAPSCAAGSTMRVSFQPVSGPTPAMTTNWVNCHPPATMTFEIAGMYASTEYNMFAQTETGTSIVNGTTVSYTTGAIPKGVTLATYTTIVPPGAQTDTTDWVVVHSFLRAGAVSHPPSATDLEGNNVWYYAEAQTNGGLLTRPLQGGNFLSIETGPGWDAKVTGSQIFRELDLAGNVVHETNIGVLQRQLLALGVTDAQDCDQVAKPPVVGAACMGGFSHDGIQTLPNGQTAVQAAIEKIYPPGTQGDTTGLPVDIVGNMIIVLNAGWQVAWYFDAFEHAGGAPQLDINRTAPLNEYCTAAQGCPFVYLLGSGISPHGHDWLHGNCLYYWPQNGDMVWSTRNQDWIMKIDYNNGAGTGNILWRMGLDGDFTFNNIYGDPWPWFSHQHEPGIENAGAGPMTIFDNGNTRVSNRPLGLGKDCGPSDCNSRGMALNFDETTMQVTPVMSVDLGVYAEVLGSAQLLTDGNYFFQPGQVSPSTTKGAANSYAIEILPTVGTDTGIQVLNVESAESYRAWQLPNMYDPPTT